VILPDLKKELWKKRLTNLFRIVYIFSATIVTHKTGSINIGLYGKTASLNI